MEKSGTSKWYFKNVANLESFQGISSSINLIFLKSDITVLHLVLIFSMKIFPSKKKKSHFKKTLILYWFGLWVCVLYWKVTLKCENCLEFGLNHKTQTIYWFCDPFCMANAKKKLIKKPFLLSWRWHSGFIIGVEILACSLPLALHLADCQDNRLKCLVKINE